MLEPVLFALFSVSAVVFAFNVVFRRNAVHCALHLVGVLLSLSGMFVLLNAQFIAAIQILIYAGAIMVLFLFVVMLLNVKGEAPLLTPGAWKGFGFFFALIVFVAPVAFARQMFAKTHSLKLAKDELEFRQREMEYQTRHDALTELYGRHCQRGDLDPAPDRGHRRGRARKAEVRLMQTLSVPLEAYQLVAALLFTIGLIGVLVRRSALIIFMSIELMLNAVNLSFVAFSRQHGQMDGQIFVFFVMSVAAAEVAVGLAILVAIFRNRETANVDEVHLLKG